MLRATAVLFVLAAPALAAQQAPAPSPAATNPFVGKWRITYPIAINRQGDVLTPFNGPGDFTVELRGDSLVAVLVRGIAPGAAPGATGGQPVRITARADTGEVIFSYTGMAGAMSKEDGMRSAAVANIFRLRVKGDSIVGTVARRMDGSPVNSHDPLPVTGVRARG